MAPNARCLVLGGNRFVGRLLVLRMLARGDRVTVLNRGTLPDPFGERVERLRCDRRTDDLARVLRGRDFDAVVDFAAYERPDVERAIEALDGRVGRYLFVSTGQVYLVREGVTGPARERDYDGPLLPRPAGDDAAEWDYGVGKRACEDALVEAFASRGFPSTRLRIPMVNGPRDPYRRLERYVHRLLDGGPIVLPGGGAHRVRHVDAHEVAATILALLAEPRAVGAAWNQAQDETPTLSELLTALARELGASPGIVEVDRGAFEARGLDVRATSPFSGRWMSFLDPTAIRGLGVGHAPLDRTIARCVAELLAHLPAPPEDYARQRPEELRLARETR